MSAQPSRPAKVLSALALWVFLPILLLVGIGMYRNVSRSPEESAALDKARYRIAQCERVMDDELQDLRTRRYARAECDRIAQEHEARWGSPP